MTMFEPVPVGYSGNNAYMITLTYHNESRTSIKFMIYNPPGLKAITHTSSLRLTTMAPGLSSYISYKIDRANGKNACVHNHVDLHTTMTSELSHNSRCFKTV